MPCTLASRQHCSFCFFLHPVESPRLPFLPDPSCWFPPLARVQAGGGAGEREHQRVDSSPPDCVAAQTQRPPWGSPPRASLPHQ